MCTYILHVHFIYTHTYSTYVYALICVSVCSLKMDYLDIHQNSDRIGRLICYSRTLHSSAIRRKYYYFKKITDKAFSLPFPHT